MELTPIIQSFRYRSYGGPPHNHQLKDLDYFYEYAPKTRAYRFFSFWGICFS